MQMDYNTHNRTWSCALVTGSFLAIYNYPSAFCSIISLLKISNSSTFLASLQNCVDQTVLPLCQLQVFSMERADICNSNSEETTQLRTMATREKGPTTKPRTHDLYSNAEFQPCELWNRPRSLVPHLRLCASHSSHIGT